MSCLWARATVGDLLGVVPRARSLSFAVCRGIGVMGTWLFGPVVGGGGDPIHHCLTTRPTEFFDQHPADPEAVGVVCPSAMPSASRAASSAGSEPLLDDLFSRPALISATRSPLSSRTGTNVSPCQSHPSNSTFRCTGCDERRVNVGCRQVGRPLPRTRDASRDRHDALVWLTETPVQ